MVLGMRKGRRTLILEGKDLDDGGAKVKTGFPVMLRKIRMSLSSFGRLC